MPSRSDGEQGTDGKRFVRRHELTPAISLYIACAALTAGAVGLRGVVAKLSRKFVSSRMFVYALASALRGVGERAFEVSRVEAAATIRSESPYHLMLSYRQSRPPAAPEIRTTWPWNRPSRKTVGRLANSSSVYAL